MQTLWNKVKSVFATKTDVNKKLDVNHVNLNGMTTTILAEVQAMAVNAIHYKRFFTTSDGGSANIPDKPTGTTNAGFVLEAICNRRNTAEDYRYVLLCYVQLQKPKIAWVTQQTTSITWNNLDTTLGTMSVDEGKTGTATTNRGLTAKNLKEIITNYLSQFEGNEKEVTFNTVNSSDGELASKRFVATYVSDEWAAATSALQKNKLEVDGSNASSTTTYNVLNAAAGGDNYDITSNEEIVTTYPNGQVAYKRTLEKFGSWVTSLINKRLNNWYGNEQEVVFNNVKVRQGINNAEIEVATKFQVSQEYEQIGNVKKIRAIEDKASYFGGEDLNSRIAIEHTNSGDYPSVFYYNLKGEGLNDSPSTGALPSDAHVFTMNWYNGTKGYIAQIAFSYNADKMWTRNKWGSSASWTDWKLMASASDSSTSEIKRYSGSSSVDYSYVGKVIVCNPTTYSAATSKSVSSWIGSCVPSTMITHGQSFILVNPSNVTYTITGLANGSYNLASNTALALVYLDDKYYRQSI